MKRGDLVLTAAVWAEVDRNVHVLFAAIDAAAKRAARLDRLVEVPPPDTAARAAILTRYLRTLPGSTAIDVTR